MPYSDQDRIRQLARLDPLIIAGGISLAFIAGFINTVSLCYFHVPVSHMTGAVSRLSVDSASLNFSEFLKISFIVFGFLSGAVFSGAMIGARNVKPTIEYSVILMIESASLVASFFLFRSEASFALFFAAFSCGLQNAMASNYLGLIIRTTHMTGIVTDLGVLIGQSFRHREIRFWKIAFLSAIVIGFYAGGLAGVFGFGEIRYYSIFIPAGMCMVGAVGFYALRVRKSPKA